MIPLFLPQFDFDASQITREQWPEAFHHATRVRRAKVSDSLLIADGAGKRGTFTIQNITKTVITLNEGHITSASTAPRVVLWIAVIEKSAMEEACHLVGQLGIAEIHFVQTEYTNTQWQEKHTERLKKIILASCTQSEQVWLPLLDTTAHTLADLPWDNGEWHVAIERSSNQSGNTSISSDGMQHVLIGPEGGWSKEERDFLLSKVSDCACKASVLDLGRSILRAQTAALVGCWSFTRQG